jgi:hypothetical protein
MEEIKMAEYFQLEGELTASKNFVELCRRSAETLCTDLIDLNPDSEEVTTCDAILTGLIQAQHHLRELEKVVSEMFKSGHIT